MTDHTIFRRPILVEGTRAERTAAAETTAGTDMSLPEASVAQPKPGAPLLGGLLLAALALVAGCAAAPHEQPKLAISIEPMTATDHCMSRPGTRAAPALIGRYYDETLRPDALCVWVTTAHTPDGRNLAMEPTPARAHWIITSQEPPAGSEIRELAHITVWVVPTAVSA
ncbi:hypothetical protein ACIGO9_30475 [Nocardia asteroides]|uniref:hypothetical protein n=1 Tax=Nocardia asteroides TaxID=1824 RepID=UPI0037C9F94F